jgi:hypothetical protein
MVLAAAWQSPALPAPYGIAPVEATVLAETRVAAPGRAAAMAAFGVAVVALHAHAAAVAPAG